MTYDKCFKEIQKIIGHVYFSLRYERSYYDADDSIKPKISAYFGHLRLWTPEYSTFKELLYWLREEMNLPPDRVNISDNDK